MAMATPGSAAEMSLRVRETEPTTPVASAASRSISFGETQPATCEFVAATTSVTTNSPTRSPTATAVAAPATTSAMLRARFVRSQVTTASIVPWIRAISGATIIAPITVAVESQRRLPTR
jgi:hypothetical protein